jgi:hypothetical protein
LMFAILRGVMISDLSDRIIIIVEKSSGSNNRNITHQGTIIHLLHVIHKMASVYKSLSKTSGSKTGEAPTGVKKNKQRVLILTSRGVTYRHRHLLNDLHSLMPHSRKDAKLDTKTKLYQLNELADLYNCNNVFFFEARKGKDL